ncbi:MAG: NADH-quinone oxidoreductase subunit H [Candidatus Sumerlaeota bacterium]|nr:NADH-quinone oxidoreductase subunit H [Candidatus Sumerlaeota bacterium]
MMNLASWFCIALALAMAPFLLGVINRTKAVVAGRKGAPLLQAYYDMLRLLRKGAVYSETTTWFFRFGPVVGLAAAAMAAMIVPFGAASAPLAFQGDLILFAYLLGLMRFVTVVAALDTGSSFEGMGASREVWFSALAEPALLLGLAAMALQTKSISLSGMMAALAAQPGGGATLTLLLVVAAFFIVFLAENARIPVDDPNTHLELTMIHEVMVLDHSGPDFAFIQYGASLKLWALGALVISALPPCHAAQALALPAAAAFALNLAIALAEMVGLAVVVGLFESGMARLRLVRVPQLLVAAGALSALALILEAMR